ncbi:MAG TPA: glycosyltransferase [Candidatus Omnitrophota bacterium]|nr:glycosyltransferase [Candidatus Omnitrophota bacterium]
MSAAGPGTQGPSHAGGPLRVLHVDSERTWRGGERQVLLLMRRQRQAGDEPRLAAPGRSALAARARAEGFPVHAVPMRGTWDLDSILRLASATRAIRPHVVHWHAARAHALGAMAALAAPGPVRVLSRRVDFPVRGSLGSRLLYGLPIEAIAAISEGVRRALEASGVPGRVIRVIPSGIDLEPFEEPFDRAAARASLGIAPDEVLAIQIAALAPHKSQTTLLQAAAAAAGAAPRLRVWIAGEGALREALLVEHRSLGLGERVRFLGFREDVVPLLRAADLFVLSSYLEGLGTSVLDAMAAGLPVVGTAVGGVPEIVESEATGLLVPPRDPGALAAAMARLSADPALRAAMGARGRERARAFSADRTAALTRALYEELLGRLPGSRVRRTGRPEVSGPP